MGPYSRTNIECDPPSRLRDLENGACTCARADAPHIRYVESRYLMGPYSRTKLGRNSPAVCEIWKTGCARAHVQMHSTSDMCKALIEWVTIHTQNLNTIRLAVCKI